MSDFYTLDGHTPVPCDIRAWARMFEDRYVRPVARMTVGDAMVSTVFLGVDHNFSGVGPPLLFETMIFGGNSSEYQERYATWDEAVAGHARVVAALEKGEGL